MSAFYLGSNCKADPSHLCCVGHAPPNLPVTMVFLKKQVPCDNIDLAKVWQHFRNTITAVTVCTSIDTLLLLLSAKNSMLCLLFLSQTCSCQEQCVRTTNSEGTIQLHNTKNHATNVIIRCSYEWCTGTRKHAWCLYMQCTGKIDSNFNIFTDNGP